ncbi:MAG: hypothetical protein ACFFDN_50545 [Candidatus Hodarchaeota archaeon]
MIETKKVVYLIKINEIRNILIEKGGFRPTYLASGPEKLVKQLHNGMRVDIKEITPEYIKYDIDPHDPDSNLKSLLRHAKNYFKWWWEGSQDMTIKISTRKVIKNPKKFNWLKQYMKKFDLICDLEGQCKFMRKI